jgi:hypothetical protein
MKKTTLLNTLLSLCVILTSCSTAKFTYLNKVKADKKTEYEKIESVKTISITESNEDQNLTTSNPIANQLPELMVVASETRADNIENIQKKLVKENVTPDFTNNDNITITQETTVDDPIKQEGTTNTTEDGGTDTNSIIGFIASIIGLIILAIPMGIIAIIFSAIGLKKTSSSGKKGRGLAIAGLIIGIIDVLLGLVIVASMA